MVLLHLLGMTVMMIDMETINIKVIQMVIMMVIQMVLRHLLGMTAMMIVMEIIMMVVIQMAMMMAVMNIILMIMTMLLRPPVRDPLGH